MSEEELAAIKKLYQGIRNEVDSLRRDVGTLNKHVMWGFTIVITAFILPIGVAIILAVLGVAEV